MKIKSFVAIFLTLSILNLFLQAQNIEQSLQTFGNLPNVKHATWGFYAQNLSTQKTISKNADAVLIPASTMKLFPCLLAMELLGPQHRFETRLLYSGSIQNQILNGNIIIQAGGDPSLCSSRFPEQLNLDALCQKWLQMIKNKGIREIVGEVIIDESYFPDDLTPGNWAWADVGNYFGSSPCAFNILENILLVHFKQSNTGEPTTLIGTTPQIPEIQWTNRVKSGALGSIDDAWVFGAPKNNYRYVEGTIPPGNGTFTIKSSLPNPSSFFKKYFTNYLKANGIQVKEDKMVVKNTEKLVEVDKIYSPELQKIVKVTLDKSINLFAEILFIHVGKKLNSSGNLTENIQKIKLFLESKKLNMNGGNISDGSGLSRTNLVSAKQFSDFITMYQEVGKNWIWEILPMESNISNLRCKSGYVARVRSFAGLIKNSKNQWISFGFIINGFSGYPGIMYQNMVQVLNDLAASDL